MPDTPQLGLAAVEGAKPAADDIRLWSVTSIIGVLDKPGLMFWSAEEAARAACAISKTLAARIEEDGLEAIVKWLRDARFRRPKDRLSATGLGSAFHAAAEQYALEGVRPNDDEIGQLVEQQAKGAGFTGTRAEVAVINQMLDQFDGWLQKWTPEYIATEVCVYSPTYGVAGTADGFFKLDGTPLIFDIKTSRDTFDGQGRQKTPYPEVSLQLAAYRYSEMAAVWRPRRTEVFRRRYYLLSKAEQEMAVPVPEVNGGVVVHVTPGSCEAYPVACDEEIHRSFLYVLEAARFHLETSKRVIGDPLLPPTRQEVPA